METQYTVESLRAKIKELELRQEQEGKVLKEQVAITVESLKPLNLVKSLVSDVFESKSLKNEFVNMAAGYASGLVAKKLIVRRSSNPVLNLLGLGAQLAMTTVISKNYTALKDVFVQLAGSVFSKIQDEIQSKIDIEEEE